MITFVWQAKDKYGRPVVREIEATTTEEAKAALVAEGCTDLHLMHDEIMDATSSGMPSAQFLGQELKVSATDKVKHMGKPRITMFRALYEGISQSRWLVFFLIIVASIEFYLHHQIAAAVVSVALVGWLIFVVSVSLPSIYYGKLHRAGDWYRWDEVLDLVGILERLRGIHFIKVPLPELARWRAKALAGTGRLAEALKGYEPFENQPGCPGWLHKAFIAGIYDTAKEPDKAIEFNLKSIQEHPNAASYLDLANRLARYKKDPVKAREALNQAENGTLPELGKASHLRCKGILAYLEGDYAGAKKELEAALELMERTRHIPFRDGNISVGRAYLACVLARQGDVAGAKKQYEQARPYLVATKEKELMAECLQAIGQKEPTKPGS
jgi:tetratricopeptide (TPR) repeat protein